MKGIVLTLAFVFVAALVLGVLVAVERVANCPRTHTLTIAAETTTREFFVTQKGHTHKVTRTEHVPQHTHDVCVTP